ncbi:MAG: response regulator [Myxococcota bacterium]
MQPRPKILVLDDSDTVLELTEAILSSGGYDVVTLNAWPKLAATLAKEQPALALIDVSMPILSGDSVVGAMKKSGAQSRFVLFSDRPEAQLRPLAEACGATGYICKTGEPQVLLERVASFLGAPAPATAPARKAPTGPIAVVAPTPLGVGLPVAWASELQLGGELVALAPSLIVFDVTQPRARLLAALLNDTPALAAVPLLATAPVSGPAAWREALACGASDFLTHDALARDAARCRQSGEPPQVALLADPNPLVRRELAGLARLHGLLPVTASTTAELETLLDQLARRVDLVLADAPLVPHAPLLLNRLRALNPAARFALLSTGLDTSGPLPTLPKRGDELAVFLADQPTSARLDLGSRRPWLGAVEFSSDAGSGGGLVTELTRNMIFIATLRPAGRDARLRLSVEVEGGRAELSGRVAWSHGFARHRAQVALGMAVVVDDTSALKERM